MSAVETLEAAILKLEALRDAGSGPWKLEPVSDFYNARLDGRRILGNDGNRIFRDGSYAIDPGELDEPDALLIVTLHSTITPMLGWLRDQAERMRVEENPDGIYLHYRHSLALADAILGDTQ